jgi:hypothetical protein
MWLSRARDWSRQHILPLRLDSQVVIHSGENLIGKTTELVLTRTTMQRIGMYRIAETLCIGENHVNEKRGVSLVRGL